MGIIGSGHIIANKNSYITIGSNAEIFFDGSACFGEGSSLRCDEGKLFFGDRFSTNKNCCISSNYKMTFKEDVLLGWNVNIRDSDGHTILKDDEEKVSRKEVIIGQHVWICSYSDILKGVEIYDGCVVAWRSCVLKSVKKNNCLIGGFPAKVIQENIKWKK